MCITQLQTFPLEIIGNISPSFFTPFTIIFCKPERLISIKYIAPLNFLLIFTLSQQEGTFGRIRNPL